MPLRITPVVKKLLIINILMFLITLVLPYFYSPEFDLSKHLGLHFYKSIQFKPYQYVSYMFMHGNFSHLFFNMFALWMLGGTLEELWGGKRFFIYYMATGIGAAIFHTMINWIDYIKISEAVINYQSAPGLDNFIALVNDNFELYKVRVFDNFIVNWESYSSDSQYITSSVEWAQVMLDSKISIPTVGASGAIFGILLAYGVLFPNAEFMLIIPPIPIKAKFFVLIYGGLEFYFGITNYSGDNIAHFAHLGGMIFGFLLLWHWKAININKLFKS